MDKQAQYLQTIHATYPDLGIQSAEILLGGQYNDILIVNGDTIFRFPRYAAALDMLVRETAVLRHIQGHLPLPIPNPIYTSLDRGEVGQAFTGYRMIPGEAVNIYELEGRYDSATCQQLADQLAVFLRALHTIPTDGLSAERDELAFWTELYAHIQEKLFPLMSPSARDEMRQHFEPYLSDPHNFYYSCVVVHGDFGTGNILFDPARLEFTGVIDFGYEGLGDPALDFAAIYGFRGRGAAFAKRFFKLYPELENMMDRVHFYTGTYLLQEALFGVENNEPELIESGLVPYR